MFIVKLILKVIMLPMIIAMGFITVLAKIVSSLGEFVSGLLIIAALIMMIYNGIHHDWYQFAYAASVGFIVFAMSFMGVLVCEVLDWVNRKMMAILFI